jgi:hypothetical protein
MNKPVPKSLRVAGQNPNGGQKGRTLCKAAQPDKIVMCLKQELRFARLNDRYVVGKPANCRPAFQAFASPSLPKSQCPQPLHWRQLGQGKRTSNLKVSFSSSDQVGE